MPSLPKGDSSTVECRLAREDDAPALSRTRVAFWTDQISKGCLDHPNIGTEEILVETRSLIRRARTILFLATDGAAIAAYVLAQMKFVPGPQGGSISSIEEIYVGEGYRRSSLGHQLVEKTLAQLKDLGATRIQLRVLDRNDTAKSFWQRNGFSPSVVIYEHLK